MSKKLHYNPVEDSILDVKLDKRSEVYNHGKNNAHPSLIETLIEGSVTAKTSVDKVAKAIYGASFGEKGEIVVNKDGQTLNEVLRVIAREYAKHNNVYIHIGYNGELEINSIKVIPNTYCRKGKDDDTGHISKIVVYDNWDKSQRRKIEPAKFQYIDVFNPRKKVIEAQIEKAGGIRTYKGQILHIQKDPNAVYSLSDLHPVMDDALSEAKSATFRRRGSSHGFLNTKLLVMPPSTGEEQEEMLESIAGVQGADNSGGIVVLETTGTSDDLKKEIMLADLTTPFDDKQFAYTEAQARKNIALAYGVPLPLIDVSDSSLFGNSGELIKQMRIQMWESRDEERNQLEAALQNLIEKSVFDATDLEVLNPFEDKEAQEIEEAADEQTRQIEDPASAVDAVLKLQESIESGYTNKNAAVAVLSTLYGIDKNSAMAMLNKED